ncbi:MAG TPA: penicillin-binding transpeptidase domain-containing protein [Bacteroidia bacterium]|nr:penicillin-binding transpeptidase domain-containing protein [Bacteroidia bacterium]
MNPFNERKFIFIGLMLLVAIVYTCRLFYVQVLDDRYKLDARNQALRYVTDYPPRGFIYDRNGKLLVINQIAYDLMVVPKQAKNIDTTLFCKLLGITKESYIRKMRVAKNLPNSPIKPSIFEKQMTAETYSALQEKIYKFKGFFVQTRTIRKYPDGIASHLLGYIGEVDKEVTEKNPYYHEGDYIGISGVEKTYEEYLRGKKGTRITMVDVHNVTKGSFQNGKYDTAAVPGDFLTSSLDADVQLYGEKLMTLKKGGIVAIDPSTGEILCVISSPGYDPNLLVGRERSSNFAMLLRDTAGDPLFNRALMSYYPPGSTFKLINGLVAQQEKVLFPETRYPCARGYPVMGGKPGCHQHASPLDLQQAVAQSCNSYFSYTFRSIIDQKRFKTTEEGYRVWRDYVLSFGVGRKINTDLPHELRGMVPTPEFYDKYFGKGSWKSSTIVSLAIGQGELGITPLQMANIMCIMANRGYYYVPHILKSIGEKKMVPKTFTEKNYTKVEKQYFDIMVDGMEQVVAAGTGRIAKYDDTTHICGKTGTAQNPHGDNHSVFVAFAPKDHPRIAIAVLVENAGYGAEWACPIASLLIEKYLTRKITRPALEKKMLEADLIHKVYHPHKKD